MPLAGLNILLGLFNAKVGRLSGVCMLIAHSSSIFIEFRSQKINKKFSVIVGLNLFWVALANLITGCAEIQKPQPKVETVEQLLVELDYGFVNGLFDDEKFFEERIGYKLSGFPKDMEPKSFSGPASGVGFEMSDGIFPGRKIIVSKVVLRDGGKILRISFPVPPCLEKWRVPRFFPHNIIYVPSNFVYGVRSPNEPSLYSVRNYFGGKEQFVTFFVGGLDHCVSEIMVGTVYR